MRIKEVICAVIASILNLGIAEAKTVEVGYVFRIHDKYDSNAISSMVNGIKAARIAFEKKMNVKINLKEYAYDNNLSSLTKAADQIIKDKVKIVIGPEMSDEAIVMGDLLSSNKTVLISPTASNPKISKGRPYVFSTCFSDKFVSKKLAVFTAKRLKTKSIGVLRQVDSTYSDFLATSFKKYINDLKPEVKIIEKAYLGNSMSFENAINEFKSNSVGVVAVLAYEGSLLEFVNQANLKDYHPILIGSDGWGTNSKIHDTFVLKSSSGQSFHAYRATYWKREGKSRAANDLKKYLNIVTKKNPNEWNAMAYDTALIAFRAAYYNAGSGAGDKIRKYLLKTTFSNLVTTKKLKINSDGTSEKDIHLYRIDKSGVNHEETL